MCLTWRRHCLPSQYHHLHSCSHAHITTTNAAHNATDTSESQYCTACPSQLLVIPVGAYASNTSRTSSHIRSSQSALPILSHRRLRGKQRRLLALASALPTNRRRQLQPGSQHIPDPGPPDLAVRRRTVALLRRMQTSGSTTPRPQRSRRMENPGLLVIPQNYSWTFCPA